MGTCIQTQSTRSAQSTPSTKQQAHTCPRPRTCPHSCARMHARHHFSAFMDNQRIPDAESKNSGSEPPSSGQTTRSSYSAKLDGVLFPRRAELPRPLADLTALIRVPWDTLSLLLSPWPSPLPSPKLGHQSREVHACASLPMLAVFCPQDVVVQQVYELHPRSVEGHGTAAPGYATSRRRGMPAVVHDVTGGRKSRAQHSRGHRRRPPKSRAP